MLFKLFSLPLVEERVGEESEENGEEVSKGSHSGSKTACNLHYDGVVTILKLA